MANSRTTRPPVLVIAIDFGSHGSGYAFSFDYEYATNPVNIHVPEWSSESGTGSWYKAPSCILLDKTKKFVAFGHQAEDEYVKICQQNLENLYYFLRHFKMKLYKAVVQGQDVRNDFEIEDLNGKKVSAKYVFELAITFLRNEVLKQLTDRNLVVDSNVIKWVMTVPAIWNDACKQFMREAAQQAGLVMDNICFVYEPEAASIYCRCLPVDKFKANNTTILKTFDPGKKFIVVDAGGGTVDISVQEVLSNGHLKIIDKTRGGSWGGEWVNQEYRTLLKKLIGGDVLTDFKKNHGLDYIEMIRAFEKAKGSYSNNTSDRVVTRFPGSLTDKLLEITDCDLRTILENSTYKDEATIKRDRLFLSKSLFESFFDESVNLTVTEIKEVLQHERCAEVSAVMLVGGFSESPILQRAIKEALDLELFIPTEGALSVLKGAVIYGHNPNIITSRVCNHTYGVSLSVPFNREIHPQEKHYWYDKEEWCKHIFRVCFCEGQEVKVGDVAKIELNNTFESESEQRKRSQPLTVEIFISDKKNPKFVTDPGCKLLAKIRVNPPNGEWPIYAFGWVELEVAGTEIVATYVFAETEARYSTKFEFLPSGYKPLKGERNRVSEMS